MSNLSTAYAYLVYFGCKSSTIFWIVQIFGCVFMVIFQGEAQDYRQEDSEGLNRLCPSSERGRARNKARVTLGKGEEVKKRISQIIEKREVKNLCMWKKSSTFAALMDLLTLTLFDDASDCMVK